MFTCGDFRLVSRSILSTLSAGILNFLAFWKFFLVFLGGAGLDVQG